MKLKIVGIVQRLGKSHGVVLRERPKEGIAQRASKRRPLVLGTMAGSTGHEIASEWCRQRQIPVRFLYLSPAQQLIAFRDRYIDGIASWEPFLTRAKNLGGVSVGDATCLPHSIFNVLCVTESALSTKLGAIWRFLQATATVSAKLATGECLDELRSLPWLYGKDTTLEQFQTMIREGYRWPAEPLSDFDKTHLDRALKASHDFLERSGFPTDRSLTNQVVEILAGPAVKTEVTLNVGYTDSFMCTAYHLALVQGTYQEHGFIVPLHTLTRGQRLAMIRDTALANDLAKLEASAAEDPVDVMAKCRVISEELVTKVFSELHDEKPENQKKKLEPMLMKLEQLNAFSDTSVYAAAQTIRTSGNWATHKGRASTIPKVELVQSARELVNQLLKVIEWYETEGKSLAEKNHCCVQCEQLLERSEAFCTHCGTQQHYDCSNCPKKDLKPRDKFCPDCGTRRTLIKRDVSSAAKKD
ncbi:double zinc ribbon domain-containing protein [Terriglobus roseus]|nr:zinc ribbon domain-containing protein [Terriglobus roseus]